MSDRPITPGISTWNRPPCPISGACAWPTSVKAQQKTPKQTTRSGRFFKRSPLAVAITPNSTVYHRGVGGWHPAAKRCYRDGNRLPIVSCGVQRASMKRRLSLSIRRDGPTMSNTQQAKANSERPIRPGGVLVNFPTPRFDPSESPCKEFSLPYSGETQWDDQSFLTPSGITGSESDAVPSPVRSNDASSENPDPVPVQLNSAPADVQPDSQQPDESLVSPVAPVQPKRNWLERWLFPDTSDQDKRGGDRKPAPGLIAHFWTGGPPKSQPVRDISATGLYVVTEERWYLGTQIRITLTKMLDGCIETRPVNHCDGNRGPLGRRRCRSRVRSERWRKNRTARASSFGGGGRRATRPICRAVRCDD